MKAFNWIYKKTLAFRNVSGIKSSCELKAVTLFFVIIHKEEITHE